MPRASWGPQHQWFSRASFYRVCYCEYTFRSSHWHMRNPVTPLSVLWSFLSYIKVLVSWEFQVGNQDDPHMILVHRGLWGCNLSPSDSSCLASSLHIPQPGTAPSTDLRFLFLVFGWPLYSGVIVSLFLLHGGSHISFCPSIKVFLGNAYSYKQWAVTL